MYLLQPKHVFTKDLGAIPLKCIKRDEAPFSLPLWEGKGLTSLPMFTRVLFHLCDFLIFVYFLLLIFHVIPL